MRHRMNEVRSLVSAVPGAAALVALCIAALGVGAADRSPHAQACPSCGIRFDLVATVGSENDSLLMGPGSVFAVMGNGDYLVSAGGTVGSYVSIGRYDRSGRLLGYHGREGPGPGEFRNIWTIRVTNGDTVLVFDSYARRIAVLDPALRYVRTIRLDSLTGVMDFWPLTGGRVLVRGHLPTREQSGWPLHILSAEGRILRSFGADTPYYDPRPFSWNNWRVIHGSHQTGAICSAHLTRYQVDCWDGTGQAQRTIRRDVEWLPGSEFAPNQMYDVVPWPTTVSYAYRDSSERIWLSILMADRNWRARDPAERPGRGESGLASGVWIRDAERFSDTMYEVLDVRTGAVLASYRDDRWPGQFMSDGRLGLLRETANGFVILEVYRLEIVPPR